jgi:hypothetical protein
MPADREVHGFERDSSPALAGEYVGKLGIVRALDGDNLESGTLVDLAA